MMKKFKRKFKRMLKTAMITENPTFVSFLALCPTLGVTTRVGGAVGMGISVIIVLTASNVLVSMIRKLVPYNVRIPVYITIIATLVTVIELLLETFIPSIYSALGIFLPLIVVNCIILGRAESYASKNKVSDSFIDGLTMGIAFTASLVVIAFIREFFGTGSIQMLNVDIFPPNQAINIFQTGAGAFFTVALLAWLFNLYKMDYDKKLKQKKKTRERK